MARFSPCDLIRTGSSDWSGVLEPVPRLYWRLSPQQNTSLVVLRAHLPRLAFAMAAKATPPGTLTATGVVCAEKSAPLVRGYELGSEVPPVVESERTIADGIIVKYPVRGREVLSTLRQTGGAAIRVSEEAIAQAQQACWHSGFICEATSAVTIAALPQVRAHLNDPAALIVCALTGNALKTVGLS